MISNKRTDNKTPLSYLKSNGTSNKNNSKKKLSIKIQKTNQLSKSSINNINGNSNSRQPKNIFKGENYNSNEI